MQTHADRENSHAPRAEAQGDNATRQFADQRPAAASQNRLACLAAASPQIAQLRAIQAMADASPGVETTRRLGAGQTATAQRQAMEEEEPLQGKFVVAQRAAMEDEEPVQGKFATVQRAAAEEDELQMKTVGTPEPAAQLQAEAAPRKNDTGLPDNLKSGVESLSGMSMDNVRVHYNSSKPAQLNAYAYAQGTDIHVGPGQEKHLPHEAWHVVQQAQGRVRPTMQLKGGVAVNDDAGLEGEADLMGRKAQVALTGSPYKTTGTTSARGGNSYFSIQRAPQNKTQKNIKKSQEGKERFKANKQRQLEELENSGRKDKFSQFSLTEKKDLLQVPASARVRYLLKKNLPSTFKLNETSARLASFSKTLLSIKNGNKKLLNTPEIQIAKIKKQSKTKPEQIFISGNSKQANNQLRNFFPEGKGLYNSYKNKFRNFSIERKIQIAEQIPIQDLTEAAKKDAGSYFKKDEVENKESYIEGYVNEIILEKLNENREYQHFKRMKKYVYDNKNVPVSVPSNTNGIHAECAIEESIDDKTEEIVHIGGSKCACAACMAKFISTNKKNIIGDVVGDAFPSKGCKTQLGASNGADFYRIIDNNLSLYANSIAYNEGGDWPENAFQELDYFSDSEDEELLEKLNKQHTKNKKRKK